MRLDVYLVKKGLAPSRTRAQQMIDQGCVTLVRGEKRQSAVKSSFQILGNEWQVEVAVSQENDRFVSRGGIKMAGALAHTRLEVKGFRVLDLGISTGGFADCLLQAGAHSIVGIDVGHGQLAPKLAADPRVQLIEGANARNLVENARLGPPRPAFDLVVADLSFISLTLVLPQAIQYLKEGARVLALVKPQFEVGRGGIGKGGIVKDTSLLKGVETKIRECCASLKLDVEDYFASTIEGSDGNREFFVLASEHQSRAQIQLI